MSATFTTTYDDLTDVPTDAANRYDRCRLAAVRQRVETGYNSSSFLTDEDYEILSARDGGGRAPHMAVARYWFTLNT